MKKTNSDAGDPLQGRVLTAEMAFPSDAYGKVHTDGSRSGGQPPALGTVADLLERLGNLSRDTGWTTADEAAALIRQQAAQLAERDAEIARLREAWATLANKINIVGSEYDQVIQALDRLVLGVKKQAREALAKLEASDARD